MNDHSSTIQLANAIAHNSLVRSRLQKLKETHPKLTNLINKIPDDCSISSRFATAYFKSNLKPSVKSLVLRTLLGDPGLFPNGIAPRIDLSLYQRTTQYFEHHPKLPLSALTPDFKKDDIPRHLEATLGISRTCPRSFLSQFGLVLYLRFRRRQKLNGIVPFEIQGETDLSFLCPFYVSRRISERVCEELLTGSASHHSYATYFDTGDAALDLRNMLFYLREFWKHDRQGGRLQSKIPKLISDKFNLTRVSIPELATLSDILPLAHIGAIYKIRLKRKDDKLGVLTAMDCVNGSQIEDLETLLLDHSENWLMTPEKAEVLFVRKSKGSREGQYDTSYYFNMDRLMPKSMWKRFAPYYAAIDDTVLKRHVNRHYRNLSPAFADKLKRIQKRFTEEFTGIRIRDLSNILFYVWHHTKQGRDRRGILPAVAKYALGVEEYSADSTGSSKNQVRRRRNRSNSPSNVRLPLLDRFLQSLSKCYLLYPGYQGPIPEDGPVFLPRSVSAAYSGLPQSITLIGPKRLPWGQDPYDMSSLKEIKQFDSVVPLKTD